VQWSKGALVPSKMLSLTCATYALSVSEYSVSWIWLQPERRALSGLLSSGLRGALTTAPTCSPESSHPGKATRTKCSYSWAMWQVRTAMCITVSKVLWPAFTASPDMIFPEEVLKTSTGCSGPQGLLGSQRNTQKKQGILSTTKGHPGLVHVFRTSMRKPPGTSKGSSGNTHPWFLPRSELRSGLQNEFYHHTWQTSSWHSEYKCFCCWNIQISSTFRMKCHEYDSTLSKAQVME
jgi:hypothetical protein